MDLKEFFKPTKWKIVLIILLVIPLFVINPCVERELFYCQFLSNIPSAVFVLLNFLYTSIKFPVFLFLEKFLAIPYRIFLPSILILLINLLYWYFLVCLLEFIIKKIKK